MTEADLTLNILTALDAVVLERQAEGLLYLLTPVPDWFAALYPETLNRSHKFIASGISPFLENFLFDAEAVWAGGAEQKYASEFWTETSADGREFHLRAIAFTVHQRPLLLVSEVGAVFADRQAILQKAREGSLHIHALQRAEQKLRVSEAALERARDLAVHTARMKSEFLANMSHEIRTPLNGVIGLADLLLETPLNEEQIGYAQTIQASAETLLRIVNDILDFSKIEAGKLTLECLDFDLPALLESVTALFARPARSKNITLATRIHDDVSPALCGDPVRLRQILSNLVGNAVKFTERGQVTVEVEPVSRRDDTETLRFTIADTGPGLTEEAQTRLFQPFTQTDGTTTRRYGGTGLGLAICKQLVQLMGGHIGVASAPGQGAAFWFTVPFDQAANLSSLAPFDFAQESGPVTGTTLAGEAPQFSLKLDEASALTSHAAHILLVEDNLINQRVAQKHLAYLGYQTDLANDGHEALAALKRHDYDLIFMDCQMAGLDGFGATAEIRQTEGIARHTPIVAMTAHALPGDRERCLAAGMDDYLAKPVRRTDLAAMLERWLPADRRAASNSEAHTPSADETPEFTLEVLREAIGWAPEEDPVMLAEVLQLFQQGASERLAEMRAALAKTDMLRLKELGHALRGSCSALGMGRMAQLIRDLEEAARAAETIQVRALLSNLEHEFSRVQGVLGPLSQRDALVLPAHKAHKGKTN